MEIFHSQASDKHNESISGRRKGKRGGRGWTGSYRWKMRKNSLCRKSFSFFSVSLPSNVEGKGKKNFHLPVGCCFLLLRGLCVRGRGSKSVLKCKEMFVCALQLLLGNGMKQAQQPQHKETKGCRGEGGRQAHPCFQK